MEAFSYFDTIFPFGIERKRYEKLTGLKMALQEFISCGVSIRPVNSYIIFFGQKFCD